MQVRCTKTFPNYAEATAWLHERGFDGAVVRMPRTMAMGPVTVTLEGEDAKRAIEEETQATVVAEGEV